MGRFLTKLRVEKLPKQEGRGRWRLTDWLIYESDTVGLVLVPPRYVTDFASVPRLPFMYLLFGGQSDAEATLHDFLYSVPHSTGTGRIVTRALADRVLRGAKYNCDRADMDSYEKVTLINLLRNAWAYFGAWCFWAGVRLVGWRYWQKKKRGKDASTKNDN